MNSKDNLTQPATAIQPDMPESAIASGCIDFILSPADISKEIIRIAKLEAKTNKKKLVKAD